MLGSVSLLPTHPPPFCYRWRASLLRRDGGGDVVSIYMHKGGRSMLRIDGVGNPTFGHAGQQVCMSIACAVLLPHTDAVRCGLARNTCIDFSM